FFHLTAPTEIYTLSLHDALPIFNYSWGMTIIAIKQAYPGHAMRAAHGALGGTAGYHGRFVIVVDDDIDPFDLDDVLWAVATRCEDRKSTRLNSSHVAISYAVFCL